MSISILIYGTLLRVPVVHWHVFQMVKRKFDCVVDWTLPWQSWIHLFGDTEFGEQIDQYLGGRVIFDGDHFYYIDGSSRRATKYDPWKKMGFQQLSGLCMLYARAVQVQFSEPDNVLLHRWTPSWDAEDEGINHICLFHCICQIFEKPFIWKVIKDMNIAYSKKHYLADKKKLKKFLLIE